MTKKGEISTATTGKMYWVVYDEVYSIDGTWITIYNWLWWSDGN